MPLNLMQRFSGSRAATMEGAATRGAPSKAEGKTSGGETRCAWQPGCVQGVGLPPMSVARQGLHGNDGKCLHHNWPTSDGA
jgi:hypothetical protein